MLFSKRRSDGIQQSEVTRTRLRSNDYRLVINSRKFKGCRNGFGLYIFSDGSLPAGFLTGKRTRGPWKPLPVERTAVAHRQAISDTSRYAGRTENFCDMLEQISLQHTVRLSRSAHSHGLFKASIVSWKDLSWELRKRAMLSETLYSFFLIYIIIYKDEIYNMLNFTKDSVERKILH